MSKDGSGYGDSSADANGSRIRELEAEISRLVNNHYEITIAFNEKIAELKAANAEDSSMSLHELKSENEWLNDVVKERESFATFRLKTLERLEKEKENEDLMMAARKLRQELKDVNLSEFNGKNPRINRVILEFDMKIKMEKNK